MTNNGGDSVISGGTVHHYAIPMPPDWECARYWMDHPPHIIITSKESQMQSKSAFNIISQHDKDKMEDASTESARCTTETENQPLGNPDGKTLGPKTKASEGEAFVVQLHQLKQITTRRFSIHADRSGKPLQYSSSKYSKSRQSHFLRSSSPTFLEAPSQYSTVQSHFLRKLSRTSHSHFLSSRRFEVVSISSSSSSSSQQLRTARPSTGMLVSGRYR